MHTVERERLTALMRRMAAGDGLAVFLFLDAHRSSLAATVVRVLRSFGRHDVVRDESQVDYLVQTAALVICDHAASWSPEGALPWTWAERAIRHEVVAWLGHPSVELVADDLLLPASTSIEGEGGAERENELATGAAPSFAAGDDLAHLARRDPMVALLRDAIRQVASDRDSHVHIQYRIQKGLGDRSPAHTVAAEFGLAPDNVRQIDHRVRRRLGALIARDPQYASLRELHWLAA